MRYKLVFMIALFTAVQGYSQRTLIWCGSLIDGVGNEARVNMTIVIEKNKITAVQNGFTSAGANDNTIDLKNKTVMPGWIDAHVHLSAETNPNLYLERFQLNDVDFAYRSVVFAKRTLMAGFTTVRDAGGKIVISLEKAINQG